MCKAKHVLIVDPNQKDSQNLRKLLLSCNYTEEISEIPDPEKVYEFLSGKECLPDVIFLEIKLTKMNGFRFIEKLENHFGQTLKFIITTSSRNPMDIAKSSEYSSVQKYLIKPLNEVDLMDLD
jgi:two-component SAPR family response regulator